jgi:hypothetical protein
VKRYWLFGGNAYYPGGGVEDFISAHDDPGKAEKAGAQFLAENGSLSWAHVWDAEAEAIVWTANNDPHFDRSIIRS